LEAEPVAEAGALGVAEAEAQPERDTVGVAVSEALPPALGVAVAEPERDAAAVREMEGGSEAVRWGLGVSAAAPPEGDPEAVAEAEPHTVGDGAPRVARPGREGDTVALPRGEGVGDVEGLGAAVPVAPTAAVRVAAAEAEAQGEAEGEGEAEGGALRVSEGRGEALRELDAVQQGEGEEGHERERHGRQDQQHEEQHQPLRLLSGLKLGLNKRREFQLEGRDEVQHAKEQQADHAAPVHGYRVAREEGQHVQEAAHQRETAERCRC
jgi:hypothetical protein